jgi:nucleoside-diphosphate-sugar epimerase
MYGRQKRDGENAVLAAREQGARAAVLRVPLLYVPFIFFDPFLHTARTLAV